MAASPSAQMFSSGAGKIMWELVRMAVVAFVAFTIAQWRTEAANKEFQASVKRSEAMICAGQNQLGLNQQTVLSSLITLTLSITDRTKAGITPVPASLLDDLTRALARIPDTQTCGIPVTSTPVL